MEEIVDTLVSSSFAHFSTESCQNLVSGGEIYCWKNDMLNRFLELNRNFLPKTSFLEFQELGKVQTM